jgi:hypothetical protein
MVEIGIFELEFSTYPRSNYGNKYKHGLGFRDFGTLDLSWGTFDAIERRSGNGG